MFVWTGGVQAYKPAEHSLTLGGAVLACWCCGQRTEDPLARQTIFFLPLLYRLAVLRSQNGRAGKSTIASHAGSSILGALKDARRC